MFVQLNEWLLDVCSLATFSYSVKFPAVRVDHCVSSLFVSGTLSIDTFATPLPRSEPQACGLPSA